jgi:hypothetical protein
MTNNFWLPLDNCGELKTINLSFCTMCLFYFQIDPVMLEKIFFKLTDDDNRCKSNQQSISHWYLQLASFVTYTFHCFPNFVIWWWYTWNHESWYSVQKDLLTVYWKVELESYSLYKYTIRSQYVVNRREKKLTRLKNKTCQKRLLLLILIWMSL